MKIEDEIKQSTFKSEYHKLMINQLFTGKWISEVISKHLKPYDLSTQQYNVLRILRGQKDKSIPVSAISDRMIDKMSNVSRLLDKLQKKQLIERTTNEIDRRQMDIRISKAGLDVLAKIDEEEKSMSNYLTNLSLEEAKQMNDLLDKLRGTEND